MRSTNPVIVRLAFTELTKFTRDSMPSAAILSYDIINLLHDERVKESTLCKAHLKIIDAAFYDDKCTPIVPVIIHNSFNGNIFVRENDIIESKEIDIIAMSNNVQLKFTEGIPPKFILIVDIMYTLQE